MFTTFSVKCSVLKLDDVFTTFEGFACYIPLIVMSVKHLVSCCIKIFNWFLRRNLVLISVL